MRKLVWFVTGFAAACAAGVYLLSGYWFLLIGLLCLFSGIILHFLHTKPAKIMAVVLLGGVIGFAWLWGYDSLYLSPAHSVDGEMTFLSITASDYSYPTGYGQAFVGHTELEGKTYQIKSYLNEDVPVVPGDVVVGEFRLRYTANGGKQEPTYHQGKGIFLLAYEKNAELSDVKALRFTGFVSILRQAILNRIDTIFPSDGNAFAKALLVGDTTDFTYKQDRAFQVSGIRHVVAISGLHVSILFALIHLTFGRNRVWNAIIGIPMLMIFAAIAGFTPSIVRACIMQGLILVSLLVNKEYDPPTALAFSVLVILGVNPRAITSISFQLSVGCMIGIFAFAEPLRKYILSHGKLQKFCNGKGMTARFVRSIAGSVAVTKAAMIVTTPLCAIHFGVISLLGILTNLLTLWIVSFIFYGIMLSCLLSYVWLPLGQMVAWVVAWPIRYVVTVADVVAEVPFAAVYTDSVYIIIWLIFTYVFLAVFFLYKKKQPGILAAGVVGMLLICVLLSWVEPKLEDTRVAVIDVGQGQSILLQHEKKHYLVDCGGTNIGQTADTVANFLLSQGIFRLDGVILTHYDSDHAGSIMNLLTVIDTEKLFLPDAYDSNGIRKDIEAAYVNQIEWITDETKLDLQGGNIILYPAKAGVNDNESSLCVLFQSENYDILITGDRSRAGERVLLSEVELPMLELLIAGHHGSHTATSLELLMATKPDAVAISVGENNPYGHPREELLDRLSRFDCRVYRTDLQGTIIFRG